MRFSHIEADTAAPGMAFGHKSASIAVANLFTGATEPSMTDQIRYDLLTQLALRGVVRSVLADVVKKGLPGEHHFYVSFDTQMDGVRMSQRLRTQYPEEMTIILQHQFWDLRVDDDGFEVGLSFGGVPERLAIPFGAIKSFFDPSVQFGLQFEEIVEGEANAPAASTATPESEHARMQPSKSGAQAAKKPMPVPANPESQATPPTAAPAPQTDSGSAQVVQLDRFRKK